MKTNKLTTILLVLALIAGLSLMLYPSFSNWWNERVQSQAISNYEEAIKNLTKEDYSPLWDQAREFNRELLRRGNSYRLDEEQKQQYPQVLNLTGNGIMGYIEIPAINVNLPIYHGTEESVLQVAIGHLEWTSLPVGGADTHCVVSGHRGLPSAKLFTDLDKLILGDVFMVHVLDELLTYEVDQILIVEPDETDSLLIEPGRDLMTLVTCTPYGINSHRLLVRGHRVENAKAAVTVRVTADALVVEPTLVAAILVVPILLIMVSVVLIFEHKTNKAGQPALGRSVKQ